MKLAISETFGLGHMFCDAEHIHDNNQKQAHSNIWCEKIHQTHLLATPTDSTKSSIQRQLWRHSTNCFEMNRKFCPSDVLIRALFDTINYKQLCPQTKSTVLNNREGFQFHFNIILPRMYKSSKLFFLSIILCDPNVLLLVTTPTDLSWTVWFINGLIENATLNRSIC